MLLIFNLSLFYQQDGVLLHVSCALFYHILILDQHKNTKSAHCVYVGRKKCSAGRMRPPVRYSLPTPGLIRGTKMFVGANIFSRFIGFLPEKMKC